MSRTSEIFSDTNYPAVCKEVKKKFKRKLMPLGKASMVVSDILKLYNQNVDSLLEDCKDLEDEMSKRNRWAEGDDSSSSSEDDEERTSKEKQDCKDLEDEMSKRNRRAEGDDSSSSSEDNGEGTSKEKEDCKDLEDGLSKRNRRAEGDDSSSSSPSKQDGVFDVSPSTIGSQCDDDSAVSNEATASSKSCRRDDPESEERSESQSIYFPCQQTIIYDKNGIPRKLLIFHLTEDITESEL